MASERELLTIRRAFARQMTALAGIADERVEAAFASVRREAFLGPDPWRVVGFAGQLQKLPSNDPVYAYQNVLFALQPERGVNNGSPSLHALLLHHLGVAPGDRVCHVGAGTGYYTAILAELVGASGSVTAVEFDPRLANQARSNLTPWPWVEVVCGDGSEWPRGSLDRVYVSFAVAEPAARWIDHLDMGGSLVFPLGVPSSSNPRHSAQGAAFRIARRPEGFEAHWLCPTFFVCAEGAPSGDEELHRRLLLAFERGGAEFVRSLRRGVPADPSRCWFWSPRWSLSFDPPVG